MKSTPSGAEVLISIALDTAYGERLIMYLYLPKSTAPPYQTSCTSRVATHSSFGRAVS